MRLCRLLFVVPLAVTTAALASPFQDLNFEQATVQAPPANYFPSDLGDSISATAAFPSWTVEEGTTVCTAVQQNILPLDETSIALISSGAIQGNYDIELYGVWGSLDAFASISQTGDISSGTKSILFSVRSPADAGSIAPIPIVSVNGTPISVFEISSAGGIEQWGGDISAFAGTTSQLTFAAAGIAAPPSQNFNPITEDIYELDSISFSTQSVPEPASGALLAIAGAGLLRRTRKRCAH